MTSSLADVLADPSAALIALFDPNEPLDAFPHNVFTHFSHIFPSSDALQQVRTIMHATDLPLTRPQIPPLGVRTPPEKYKEGSLVRFRAMIQDTSPSPEMYLARQSTTQCGGWGLDVAHPADQDQINYADLRERTVLWAITVPGESAWCADHLDGVLPQETSIHNPPRPYKFPIPHVSHIGVQVKVLNLTHIFYIELSFRYMIIPSPLIRSNLPIYTILSGY